MAQLTREQMRAIFAKNQPISIKAKGTIPVKTKTTEAKEFRGFDVEKVQGSKDLVVVRQKGSERGVLTNRKNMTAMMRAIRARPSIPKEGIVIPDRSV